MSYTQKVIPILKEAGKELLKHFGKVEILRKKSALPVDVVTKLDTGTEKFVSSALKRLYPEIDFYGEEFGGGRRAKKFWLLDPIDGTAHYVRGVPLCTTMIALIESGRAVFSAIYDFVKGDIYTAEKGRGAKLNGRPIHVSSRPLKDAYLFFEIDLDKQKNLNLFLKLKNKCMMLDTINCGFEFSAVSAGKMEGRLNLDAFGKDWDYAPGAFLVKEAGGVVFNIGKTSYDFKNRSFFAGSPIVGAELRKKYRI